MKKFGIIFIMIFLVSCINKEVSHISDNTIEPISGENILQEDMVRDVFLESEKNIYAAAEIFAQENPEKIAEIQQLGKSLYFLAEEYNLEIGILLSVLEKYEKYFQEYISLKNSGNTFSHIESYIFMNFSRDTSYFSDYTEFQKFFADENLIKIIPHISLLSEHFLPNGAIVDTETKNHIQMVLGNETLTQENLETVNIFLSDQNLLQEGRCDEIISDYIRADCEASIQ